MRAGAEERAADAEGRHEHGRDQRPRGHARDEHGLEDTEGVRQQIAPRGPLEQRHRGDVDDGDADPDDREQEERCSLRREQREQR